MEKKWWEDPNAKFLIIPESLTGLILSSIFLTVNMLDMVSFTYIWAFKMFSLRRGLLIFSAWETFCDISMVIQIILTFITAKEKSHTSKKRNETFLKWEINMKVIAIDYLKFYFLLDFLGCVPTLITGNKNQCTFFFKFFRIALIPRLFYSKQIIEEAVHRKFSGNLTTTLNVY